MHKIPTHEKSAKKSKTAKLDYVNCFEYIYADLLFSPPVEKPVESVEKYLFSTAIRFFTIFRPLHKRLV